MPWTFSHPAIVFPIKQSKIGKFLNLPALIIGSVSPDLFYSVGLYNLSTKAHHFTGWFYTAFPVCIVMYMVISILSSSLNKIFPIPIITCKNWSLKNCIIIILSLFIGTATHIIWDSFTHETGSFVRNINFLQYNILNLITNKQEIHIYKLLQYFGSLLGLLYLCVKYWQYHCKLHFDEQVRNKQKLCKLLATAVLSACIIFPVAMQNSYTKTGFQFNRFIFNQLRLTELVFFVLIAAYALWINRRNPNRL